MVAVLPMSGETFRSQRLGGRCKIAHTAEYGLLVQLVERLTVNQDVGGSSPSQTAIEQNLTERL